MSTNKYYHDLWQLPQNVVRDYPRIAEQLLNTLNNNDIEQQLRSLGGVIEDTENSQSGIELSVEILSSGDIICATLPLDLCIHLCSLPKNCSNTTSVTLMISLSIANMEEGTSVVDSIKGYKSCTYTSPRHVDIIFEPVEIVRPKLSDIAIQIHRTWSPEHNINLEYSYSCKTLYSGY
jgi:hypothetical protein